MPHRPPLGHQLLRRDVAEPELRLRAAALSLRPLELDQRPALVVRRGEGTAQRVLAQRILPLRP